MTKQFTKLLSGDTLILNLLLNRKFSDIDGSQNLPSKMEKIMKTLPQYSTLFTTLYDEDQPIGFIGRGTHYSVLRSVEWLDVCLEPNSVAEIHDFTVIWDEDHDQRIIQAVEKLYLAGLLSPVQFIGERKGSLTIILAARFRFWGKDEFSQEKYLKKVQELTEKIHGDYWSVEIGYFDRSIFDGVSHQTDFSSIISDDHRKVDTYLRNIDNLFHLGTKKFNYTGYSE